MVEQLYNQIFLAWWVTTILYIYGAKIQQQTLNTIVIHGFLHVKLFLFVCLWTRNLPDHFQYPQMNLQCANVPVKMEISKMVKS